ncbi:MAG: universal stress protein [Aquificaceae bacterium]|nr:universal stress protein [Aquificaceae bacterium]
MLGRVAVHISEEEAEYLSYVREVTSRLQVAPHFVYFEEEDPFVDILGFFSRPSEEKQLAINRSIGELFRDAYLLPLSGNRDQTLTRLQEDYDLLFVRYRRQLLRKSIPEWLLSETEGLRLWVYKDGARADIRKVCLPVDFSDRSLKQVEFVDALKDFFGFEYHLVYSLNMGRLKSKLSGKDYRKSFLDKEEEVRHMYTDMFGERSLDIILLEGDPYKDMVRYINSEGYDLVVVGRRGKGMKEQIGSVSLHLIRSLKCPLIVL